MLKVFKSAGDVTNYKIILVSIFFILLSIGYAGAETLTVGQGKAYATIQSAVNAANPGDVVSVDEGVYSENVVIKKNGISIMGKNREKTIIDGKKASSGIKIDQTNNVTVSDLTIRNSGASGKSDAGVTIFSAHNNRVSNLILTSNLIGISIYSESNNNVVSGNSIRSSIDDGILIYSSSNNKIFNNNIQENKIGIYADAARTSTIYSNNFIDNTNEQAYDNSGLNSWDDGRTGNYWSTHKTSGAYTISGVPKAKDNYPLSSPVTIRYEIVPDSGQKKATEETGRSSPGFEGLVVVLII